MISTSEFRNGTRLELDGVPYYIVEFQHVKPGWARSEDLKESTDYRGHLKWLVLIGK